ncbi:toxin Doc [Streptomyces hoynatensis]|uniref:Toxin Doc n=1 Tax=Streptomyces hoynatensis TaxID=1141874 RepID=A0A3A9YSM1_9ACTN|nr:toxin Doc [Streptomyces hoynatensis]RKN38494.1 toxin Doc [Streptomyces hoynatensis]
MVLIDVPWLLEVQEARMADLAVRDYSGLAAAVARHRVNTPQLGYEPDAAWRAGALLHTIVQLRPLPARNGLYGSMVAVAYMDASDEGLDAPYGGLVDLVREITGGKTDELGAAGRIRSWRV